jgi:hypothetical protein
MTTSAATDAYTEGCAICTAEMAMHVGKHVGEKTPLEYILLRATDAASARLLYAAPLRVVLAMPSAPLPELIK